MVVKETFSLLKGIPNILDLSAAEIKKYSIDRGPRKVFVVLELNKNQILDLLKDSNNKFGAKAWLILNSFVNGFLPF